MFKQFKLVLISCLLVGLVGCHTVSHSKNTQGTLTSKSIAPIILVPGTNGRATDFDAFIKNIGAFYNYTPHVLRLIVHPDHQLSYLDKPLPITTTRPFIVIAFEDSSEDGTLTQSAWLHTALTAIHTDYDYSNFAAVGYSNGGLVLTHLLEQYPQSPFKMTDLITIATPFNDLSLVDNGESAFIDHPPLVTETLSFLIAHQQTLPPELNYLNITGDVAANHLSDQVVPVNSALSGRLIYRNIANYREKIFIGPQYSHQHILSDSLVQQALMSYIDDETKTDTN